MRVALVTTTVYVPRVLERYLSVVPDGVHVDLVVAGDVQTPDETRRFVEGLDGTYLGVDEELTRRWQSEKAIGTRSIQRRNLATLHALTLAPDVVISVDDDNAPVNPTTYFHDVLSTLGGPVDRLVSTSNGWFDPGMLLDPPTVHRGFPLDQRGVEPVHLVDSADRMWPSTNVGVLEGLVIGDPDVDALERIVNRPVARGIDLSFTRSDDPFVALGRGTWAPFNTQNTAFGFQLAALAQCLVGVGRYDDIWMSYVMRAIMDAYGIVVAYGAPLAHQDRHGHDLTRDLEQEVLGYRVTPRFCQLLRDVSTAGAFDPENTDHNLVNALEVAYQVVSPLLPPRTKHANDAWLYDVRIALREGDAAARNYSREAS